MRTKGEPTLISSVRRALQLLEATASHERGAPAKRLARETGLPLGTTYHLLRTLVHEGYLHKLEDGSFVLGRALDALHEHGQAQADQSRIRPTLMALRDELDMAVYVGRYEDGEIEVTHIVDGPATPRVHGMVDLADAAHATALGKCILRQLDTGARSDHLARHHPLPNLTPHTVTHPAEVARKLTIPAPRTIEWDEQEYELGIACAAVPIAYGESIGALATSFRMERRSVMETATDRLLSAGRVLTYTLSLTM